jgi:hypothetical protein
MNKFSFINQLLQKEKFTSSQKERVIQLIAKELERVDYNEQYILNEIKLIKSQIGLHDDKVNTKVYPKEETMELLGIETEQSDKTIVNDGLQILLDAAVQKPKKASVEEGIEILSKAIVKKESDNGLNENNEYVSIANLNSTRFKEYAKSLGEKSSSKSKENIKYIEPIYLSKFLLEYNQNPILKYTCHNIDDEDVITDIISKSPAENYDFENHLKLIIKEYNNLSSKYFGKVENMHALIYTYLTGLNKKGWADDGIKINWSSNGLKQWALRNPEKVPNPGDNFEYSGFEFVPISLKSVGEEPFLFKELVIHFKHLTHIRKDNSLLSRIIRYNTITRLNKDCNISFNSFPENIEFFTDVSKLLQAYGGLIKLSVAFAKDNNRPKPEISLSLREDKAYVYLDIHHKNSVYGTSLLSTTQNRFGTRINNLIEKQINGLCDLILKADFDSNQYAEICIWPFKNNPIKLDYFEGVQFTLKLYR